ncbi:MAG: hypothetical protein ACK57D_09435, partial [Sphingobacteriales bacterium]
MKPLFVSLILVLLASCSKNDTPTPTPETMYFPPVSGSAWETKTPASLGWNEANIPALKEFMIRNNSKSLLILVNGRIVMEEYFNGHTPTTTWQWNSAGKTLAASVTGIAQQEG